MASKHRRYQNFPSMLNLPGERVEKHPHMNEIFAVDRFVASERREGILVGG
jgi:hypothetical protein